MLREAKSAGWARHGAWLWKRYVFVAGRARAPRGLRPAALAAAQEAQRTSAVHVLDGDGRRCWWCLDRFFWADAALEADDVFALAYERQARSERRLRRAHDAVRLGRAPAARREGIALDVRRAVWERDGGRCVACGSDFELQFDHVIPVAMGGASSAANLQVLCGACNRDKGASLG